MIKNEIKKSIKLALVATILLTGVTVFAETWTAPPCAAPDCNTSKPINISNVSQTKEGNITIEDEVVSERLNSLGVSYFFSDFNIGKNGATGNPELSVLGDVTFNKLGTSNLENTTLTYPADICVEANGNLTSCNTGEVAVAPEEFSYGGHFVEKRLIGSGSGATLYCGEDRPYVVGGGASCGDNSGVFYNAAIRKSIPVKDGTTYYNGWRVECAQGDNAYVYVYCSN